MMRIPPGADASQKEAAMDRMNQILEKLRSGETFDKTGTEGRDLGFFDFAPAKKSGPSEFDKMLGFGSQPKKKRSRRKKTITIRI